MTVKLGMFNPVPVEEQAKLLASHLPKGEAWSQGFVPTSNMGLLIAGLAVEFYRVEVLANTLFNEMDIRQADELITDWERSVGIPNECFNTLGTLDERRTQVELMFANFGGVQKNEDFIRVAALFGFTIEKIPVTNTASAVFPLAFPFAFFESATVAEHTLVYKIIGDVGTGSEFFPLPFPLPFSSTGRTFLQCLFEKLAPANVNVIIRTEGEL
jgi:hypothetical protein